MRLLVDAGPLISILSETDQHHEPVAGVLPMVEPPLITCWPAVTEAAWLLRRDPWRVAKLLEMYETDFIRIESLEIQDIAPIRDLVLRYADLGLQLADACLLQLADRLRIDVIFTTDQRDFRVARTPAGNTLRILP